FCSAVRPVVRERFRREARKPDAEDASRERIIAERGAAAEKRSFSLLCRRYARVALSHPETRQGCSRKLPARFGWRYRHQETGGKCSARSSGPAAREPDGPSDGQR